MSASISTWDRWSFLPERAFTALATDQETGDTSEFSRCVILGPNNDTWPRALRLDLTGSATEETATHSQYIDVPGQSRWYKFSVQPGSTVQVKLTDLPANYDLTLYKDIQAIHDELTAPANIEDLVELTAEFAPDAFAPDSFAPDAFAPDSFAPDSFAPDSFAPDVLCPGRRSRRIHLRRIRLRPDSFAPDSFAPDSFAPDVVRAGLLCTRTRLRRIPLHPIWPTPAHSYAVWLAFRHLMAWRMRRYRAIHGTIAAISIFAFVAAMAPSTQPPPSPWRCSSLIGICEGVVPTLPAAR